MKKKKQKQTPEAAVAGATATSTTTVDSDLKSDIHLHSEFMDHLIELIPARFYLSNDDAVSKPWYQGLSKVAKASLKQQSILNIKLSRRHRFDPDGEPSSTLHLLQQRQNSENPAGENIAGLEEDDSLPNPVDCDDNNKKSATYEELRAKLRRKIDLLRGNRGEKKDHEEKVKYNGKKRKRDGENNGGSSENGDRLDEDEDSEEIIQYGKVRLGDEDERKHSNKKKKKLPKAKELELAKKKQEAKKENPTMAEQESWKAATSRAMGKKVHDDVRLIKGSMKREKRKREKNTEKWKERVETQAKMKDERQRKRKENIQDRINEKKMRRIAKREKKLMRPGFEGRKEGYITKD